MTFWELQATLLNNKNKAREVPDRIARTVTTKTLRILDLQMPFWELQATLLNNSNNKLQVWEFTDSKARSVRTQTLLPLLFPTE